MPMKDEKYHIVPYQNGYRVMADNGTYYSNKPLSYKRARQQQKALYAKQTKGELFHGKGYSVLTHGGQSHIILEGEGFLGDMFAKVKQTFNNAANTFNKVVQRVSLVSKGLRNDYPPKSRETIEKYRDGVITALTIRREPIQGFINLALDYITKNKWSEAKKELNYDKLFHLSLIASVEMPDKTESNILIEKNEVINITDKFSSNRRTQYLRVPMVRPIPFVEFLRRAEEVGGSDYFLYDAFTANCQMYINLLLDANGLADAATKNFIMQDVGTLIKKLPEYTAPIARAATNIAGLANVAFFGEGNQKAMPKNEIVMKPKDFFAEHRKLVGLLDNISDKLRSEAKEQSSEAADWRRKLQGKSNGVYRGGYMSKAERDAFLKETESVKSWDDIRDIYNRIVGLFVNLIDNPEDDDVFNMIRNEIEAFEEMVANPMNLNYPESYAFDMRNFIRDLPIYEGNDAATLPRGYESDVSGEGKKGKGISPAAKKHIEKLKSFASLPPEEQQKMREMGERRRQQIVKEIEDKQRKVDEWNAEMRRRRDSPFAPIVSGLTKLGDIAAEAGSAVGVPSIVGDVYKAFAPPGSKFYDGNGKPVKWIQNVVKDMKKGAFTKQALKHKMTPQEFAKEVLANPKNYTLTTRRRAMFVKNVTMRGRGMSKDKAKELMDKLETIEDDSMSKDEQWNIVNEVLDVLAKELPENMDVMAATETTRKRKGLPIRPKNVFMKVLEGIYGEVYGSGMKGRGDEGEDDELARIFAESMSIGGPKEMAGRESRMEKPVAKPKPKAVTIKKPVASKEAPKPKQGVKRGRLSPIAEEEEKEGKGRKASALEKYINKKPIEERAINRIESNIADTFEKYNKATSKQEQDRLLQDLLNKSAESDRRTELLDTSKRRANRALHSGSGMKGGFLPLLAGLAPTLLSSLFGMGVGVKKKKFNK